MTETYKKNDQELQTANKENQSQRDHLAEKEEVLENLRLSIQGKEQEQSRISASLEDAQTRLTSLQNEIGPLRRNQEIARAEIESLNINIQHLQTQNKKLSADLGAAETDIEHAYRQLQGRKRAREAEQEQEAAAKRSKAS
jgi:chromosome segregation ATPase